jgi:hypothetical protein
VLSWRWAAKREHELMMEERRKEAFRPDQQPDARGEIIEALRARRSDYQPQTHAAGQGWDELGLTCVECGRRLCVVVVMVVER